MEMLQQDKMMSKSIRKILPIPRSNYAEQLGALLGVRDCHFTVASGQGEQNFCDHRHAGGRQLSRNPDRKGRMQRHSPMDSLVSLAQVEGAFLSHEDGRVVDLSMPSHLGADQLRKATCLLNQNRGAASASVGSLKYCEFRYLEHKIFIYYFNKGQLLLLCRPKVNPECTALKVSLLRGELESLLNSVWM
jgi:predicted regulator of Ras-like GTPase activity (Roadblock/LC7/MglB family)